MSFNRKSVTVTASDDSPVIDVSDMLDFLRLDDDSSYNALVASYVEAATEAVKRHPNRAIKTETFTYTADRFVDHSGDEAMLALGAGVHTMSRSYIMGGGDVLDIPYPPLQSITTITTYDSDNNSSVYASTNYVADLQGARIYLNDGSTWPSDLRSNNAVEIVYIAGYGSGNVPAPIEEAVRRYTQGLYDGCEAMTDEVIRLLAPYRIMDQLAW